MTAENKTNGVQTRQGEMSLSSEREKTLETCGFVRKSEGMDLFPHEGHLCLHLLSPITSTGCCPCPKGFWSPACPHSTFSGELRRQEKTGSKAGGLQDRTGRMPLGGGGGHTGDPPELSVDGARQSPWLGKGGFH